MSKLLAHKSHVPAGGGAFTLDKLTVGVFLNDQERHRLSIGSDKADVTPLATHQGWIMPAGAEGLCLFETDLKIVNVTVDAALLKDMGLEQLNQIAPHVVDFDAMLLQLLLAADAFKTESTLYRETMERALVARLGEVLAPVSRPAQEVSDARLQRVLSMIHDAPGADLSIEVMAAEANLSHYHFARVFKDQTGLSPLQYVIQCRIETAQAMLKSTALPVAEIAFRVGYEDVSRFGRAFKKHTGVTPAAFRAG